MGLFKGVVVEGGNAEFVAREAGTYQMELVEVVAGLRPAGQFNAEPKPVLRFVFEDDEGRLSEIVNIPQIVRTPTGEYGLRYSAESKFWRMVGALWGRLVSEEDAQLLDMDIPGVQSPDDLKRLPLMFTEGAKPVKGVVIRMGSEEITQPGRAVLLAVSKYTTNSGREANKIVSYAPIPKKAKAGKVPW